MTPAQSAGGESVNTASVKRKKRRRRRPQGPRPTQNSGNSSETGQPTAASAIDAAPIPRDPRAPKPSNAKSPAVKSPTAKKSSNNRRPKYSKRVDEVSAGGLVIDTTGTKGLLIGRKDLKDQKKETFHRRQMWHRVRFEPRRGIHIGSKQQALQRAPIFLLPRASAGKGNSCIEDPAATKFPANELA